MTAAPTTVPGKIPFLDLGATYRELKPALDAAFARVMESGWYIHGAEVAAFEAELAAHTGVAHAVGVGNGLDALELVLQALDVGAGDEVLVPSHTFIATWLAVSAVGAKPVPVEVRLATGNLNPAEIAAAITPRTKALIAVDLYGQPAEWEVIAATCRERGLVLIEDAAQAHGATLQGRRAGSFAHAAAFSFYPGKNLGAYGDAGAVTTDDANLAERVRLLGNYGSRRKYHHDELGRNSRLDELQAALLRERLRVLEEWNARRAALATRYLAGLANLPGLSLPSVIDGAQPVWHLFVVRHPRRDELLRLLAEAGIGTLVHYPVPPHRAGAYRGYEWPALPIADELAATVLSLPIGPHLSSADGERVIEAVRRAVLQLASE